MMSNKTIILAIVLLPILFNGCQSKPKTLEIPINTKLYNLPEEEGGKVIGCFCPKARIGLFQFSDLRVGCRSEVAVHAGL